MNTKYKSVIFDCDGTLIDTLEDIAAAVNQALDMHGFPTLQTEEYRSKVGCGLVKTAAFALPEGARTDENAQKVGACAAKLMEEQPAEKSLSKAYPGIRELLTELKSRKIKIAVLSNKVDATLHRVMHDFFSPLVFDAICGLRPGIAPKPDPAAAWEMLAEMGKNPHETIFVGDSEVDMETALNSGCFPLGVTWGFRSRATLQESGAAQIIDKPEELWDIVGRK